METLFNIDGIPEVPLIRPRDSRGAQISDERLAHDYPPEWHRCVKCWGIGYRWTRDNGRSFSHPNTVIPPNEVPYVGNNEGTWEKIPCHVCLGMGSVKARVRFLAGHRCERCGHPYIPKGDAARLHVEPSGVGGDHMGGRWSACDHDCTHGAPVRARWPSRDDWLYYEKGQPAPFDPRDLLPPIVIHDDDRLTIGGGAVVEAEWRILTVHHLDGDKANLSWWNLAALCQRCHLQIQAKVVLERIYPHEHSAWFKPHAAGYYAKVYLGLDLSRAEVEARLDELLDLERTPA